eukprot:465513-Pelagomonas_calceolata.AAC.3
MPPFQSSQLAGHFIGCAQMSYALCYKTGRSTLQPLLILRHRRHAAQTNKPHGSSRLFAAFIGSKQAYDSIPLNKLWNHL